MAKLTADQRKKVWAEWMRSNKEAVGITKAELALAFDEMDDAVEANLGAVIGGLSEPAASGLSLQGKYDMALLIVKERVS